MCACDIKVFVLHSFVKVVYFTRSEDFKGDRFQFENEDESLKFLIVVVERDKNILHVNCLLSKI